MKIEYYLPEKVLSNSDLEKIFPKLPADIVEEKVGVRERHIAVEKQTALDLAMEAGKKVLKGYDKEKIDFVLFCTQTPDYFLPSGACIIQHRLGIKKTSGAYDYNLGCSGFIYGLAMAKGFIRMGVASHILLLTGDTYTKKIHPKDRANRSIFGDGAAATIIEPGDAVKIGEFVFGTDGEGYRNLIIENGGLRNYPGENAGESIDENGNFFSPGHLYMNGVEIFNFTIQNVPGMIDDVLKRNNLSLDDIDYFIFHQANKYMLDYLRKKIRIPAEKFYNNENQRQK